MTCAHVLAESSWSCLTLLAVHLASFTIRQPLERDPASSIMLVEPQGLELESTWDSHAWANCFPQRGKAVKGH